MSYTAVSFAAYRAIESERPDALFQDPLAAYLAGDSVVSRQKAEVANKDYPGARFAVRTKYFDLAMMSAIKGMKAQNPQAKVQVRGLGKLHEPHLASTSIIRLCLCNCLFFAVSVNSLCSRITAYASKFTTPVSGLDLE